MGTPKKKARAGAKAAKSKPTAPTKAKPPKATHTKAKPPAGLAGAVKDLKSDAYRALLASASAKEVDALLTGVAWEKGKYDTVPGTLRGNTLFTGRGPTARSMAARLLAFVGAAPGKVAERLRASVESLGFEAKADQAIDVAALAPFPAIVSVRASDAARLDGGEGLRNVAQVTLWRIEELDLAAIPGPADGRVSAFDSTRVRGLEKPARADVGLFPVPAGTDLSNVGAHALAVTSAPGQNAIGPIGGSMSELEIRGPYEANALERVELGTLPRLETLEVKAPRTLREVVGIGPLDHLRRLELGGRFASIPPLAPTLRELKVSGPLTDARALAGGPGLTQLELDVAAHVRALPGLEAIGAMRDLESLRLGGELPLDFLDALPVLPRLKSVSLGRMELERIPDLSRFGPEIETVSLIGSGGFMEHDTLRRLPKLKHLWVAASTLGRHRSQIDPRLAKAGVEIHG